MSEPANPTIESPDATPYVEQIARQTATVKPKGFSVSKQQVATSPGIEAVQKESDEVASLINLAKQRTAQQLLEENEHIEGKEIVKPTIVKPIVDPALDELDGLGDLSKATVPPIAKPSDSEKKGKEYNFRQLEEKASKAETELAELRTKHAELEATLERTAFEKSPAFKSKYLQPKNAAVQVVKDFAKEMELPDATVAECLTLKGAARLKYIDEHFDSVTAATEFLRLINDVDGKQVAVDLALANHKTTQLELVETEQLDLAKEQQRTVENFTGISKQIASKLSMFREVDGDDEHNTAVKTRIETARRIVTGEASAQDILAAPFLAVACRDYIKECARLREELAIYKRRVSEDISVQPRVNGDRQAVTTPQAGKPKGALQTIHAALRR